MFLNKPKSIDKISEYKSAEEDLSYKQFKLAVWYVGHKILLQKIGLGILIAWCIGSVGYGFYGWARYLIVDYQKDNRMSAQLVNDFLDNDAGKENYSASPLQIKSANVFSGTGGKYDFVNEAINPNLRWLAEVEYKYIYAGGETKVHSTIILPGGEQILAVLGEEVVGSPTSLELVVERTNWSKINPHQIYLPNEYIAERSMFVASEINFTPAGIGELAVGRLTFKLKNNSAYGYWQPIFNVELFGSGGQLVGVTQITLDQFYSAEERDVDIRLSSNVSDVSEIKLFPLINLFEKESFMAPGV